MTEEDVDADFHAEKITADIFERFDRDENNSLTKNEFHTAFFNIVQFDIQVPSRIVLVSAKCEQCIHGI